MSFFSNMKHGIIAYFTIGFFLCLDVCANDIKKLTIEVIQDGNFKKLNHNVIRISNRKTKEEVLTDLKTNTGSFDLLLNYDTPYQIVIQSQDFYTNNVFITFQKIKQNGVNAEFINTNSPSIQIVSSEKILVKMAARHYFFFLTQDEESGETLSAEYAVRLNKTGATTVYKTEKGDEFRYLPEVIGTFEVETNAKGYATHKAEFRYRGEQIDKTVLVKLKKNKELSQNTIAEKAKTSTNNRLPKENLAAPQRLANYTIYFAQSSYQLQEDAQKILSDLLEKVAKKGTKIEIVGETDGTGDVKLNNYLAYFRAKVTESFLYNRGYSEKNITISTNDVNPNLINAKSEADKTKLRKVSIYLTH